MKFIKITLAAVCLAVFCLHKVNAQEISEKSSSVKQDSLVSETLQPIILSATFLKDSGTIAPTTMITKEEISQFSPVDLVDVVNQTPGVYIQSGAINTNRITIRGVGSRTLFGTNKIRAYFNGIPITNGAGETSIDSYNTSDIGYFEIVKGPKATQFGTNLGGTLLLSTKKPEADGLSLQNNFTVGSFGLFKHTTNLAIEDEDLSVLYSYDHLESKGFRENNAYNRNSYLLAINSTLDDNFSIGFLFQHFNTFAQIASSLSREDFEEDPAQAAFTWGQAKGFEDNNSITAGFNLESKISSSISNTTSIYFSYLNSYEPRPFNILDQFTNGYGVRSVFTKDYFNRNGTTTINLGTEWNQDVYNWETIENLYEMNNGFGSLEGEMLSDNKEKRTSVNVFGTVNFSLTQKLKTEIGLNVNNTNYQYSDLFTQGTENRSANRDFETIFAPNFNLVYALNNQFTFFGNVSRGFNYPSVEETLTPDGIINPEIAPEKGWNYEMGSKTSFFKNKLNVELSGYLLSIQDLLVAERVGDDQFIGRNAGKTEHKGLELSVNYKNSISKNIKMDVYVNTEFSAHKFIDFVDGDNDFSGNDLTGVPDKKIAAGLRFYHENGLYANTNYQYIGSQPITDDNSLFSDSYQVVNVQAGFKKEIYKYLTANISAGINNITNEKYASSILINATSFGNTAPRYFYPGEPLNFYTSLKVNYVF